MKRLIPALLAAVAISQCAFAADNSNRSPYDTNPGCRDRNVNSAAGDCVIMDTGTPRQTYPPPKKTNLPAVPAAPVVPSPREAAPASGRRGG